MGRAEGPALLERGAVVESLDAVVARAARGQGGGAFVVGEAGLGKTSVLDRLADQVRGIDVRRAHAHEMEREVAFSLAAQLLPLNAVTAPAAEPSAPYLRAARWLEGLRDRPTIFVVDDLHWADPDSLSLLSFLARRLNDLPVAFVAALRPWPPEASSVVQGLSSAGLATVHQLAPLSPAAADELLGTVTTRVLDADDRARAWDLCQGNPLLIEQLAVGLREGGGLPSEPVLLSRFAGLDPVGITCLRVAAACGGLLQPEVAAEVAGLGPTEVDGAVEALTQSGLMRTSSEGLVLTHPLFGQAVYDGLDPAVRRQLHVRCFEVLLERGLRADAVAHALRAELAGDERAAQALEDEGRAALNRGAVSTAVHHLEAAVRASGDTVSVARRFALAEGLTAAGRVGDAAELLRQLVHDGLDPEQHGHALLMLGRCSYLIGEIDRGASAFREAVDLALAHDPAQAVPPLLDESLSAWLVGGMTAALPLAERARELAAQSPDLDLRERAEATWGHVALDAGDPAGLAATTPILERLLGPLGTRRVVASDVTWPWAIVPLIANNAMHAERLDEAHAAFRSAIDAAEDAGTANALATLYVYFANLQIRRGDLTGALDSAAAAAAFAELTPGVIEYVALVRAEAQLWAGDLTGCEASCEVVDPIAGEQWFARFWLGHVRGCRLLWERDPAASDLFLVVEETARTAGVGEPCLMHWPAHAVAAHVLAGRTGDAERVVTWLDQQGSGLPCSFPRAAAALGRAHLAGGAGKWDVAVERATAGVRLFEGSGLPLQHAEALLTLGTFQRRLGETTAAREPLAEAARLAEAHGAGWIREIAMSELRLAGGRRRRVASGGLTEAEERVARLAASGNSNAEIAAKLFLSINTVETHLRHVYAKLGIRSRRQLIAGELDLIASTSTD